MENGAPGGDVSFRVRGVGSINFEPNPIYVIDGVVGGDINSFSPEDIESVSILKDASAAAIYGANGANGVIIVTTKRGNNAGKMKVSLSAFEGTHLQPRYYNLMNADQYAGFYNKAYELNGVTPPAAYSDDFRQWYYKGNWHEGTDWQKEILQKNLTQNYYLNISDGNERSNYSISANFYSEDGILINSYTDRVNLRANSDYKISKYLKVGETISLTRRKTRNSNWGAWGMALETSPLMNVYNENNNGGFEGTQIGVLYTGSGRRGDECAKYRRERQVQRQRRSIPSRGLGLFRRSAGQHLPRGQTGPMDDLHHHTFHRYLCQQRERLDRTI